MKAIQFQGINPRRKNNPSPQSDKKEKSPFDSPVDRSGNCSSSERVGESPKFTKSDGKAIRIGERENQLNQRLNSDLDLNLGLVEGGSSKIQKELGPDFAFIHNKEFPS